MLAGAVTMTVTNYFPGDDGLGLWHEGLGLPAARGPGRRVRAALPMCQPEPELLRTTSNSCSSIISIIIIRLRLSLLPPEATVTVTTSTEY